MRRLAIIPLALFALAACGEERNQVTYRTMPPAPTTTEVELDVLVIEAIWPKHRDAVCAALAELGGEVTPEIAAFAIDSFNEGAGEDMSPAGERRLIELLEEC